MKLDEDIPTSLLPLSMQDEDEAVKLKYEEESSIARGGEEQLDQKMDVKLDMELDMKTSHGRARRSERHAREKKMLSGRCRIRPGPDHPVPGPSTDPAPDTLVQTALALVPTGNQSRDFVGVIQVIYTISSIPSAAYTIVFITWELKIERLWRLHDYTEDRKIKLASSEFDGYALRWWDGLVRAREEDGELPIITWRTMKAAMRARFVPTNYLRSVFDKLTQLKQGVMTVDAYYMEMEMLMQRARVRESLEMTLQRFLNGLKFNIKGIVRHHSYTTMNELLHHAREAESQLAEEAQQRGRATGAGRYTPRPPPSTAPSTRPTDVPSSSSKPVSNVSNTKRPVPAASGTGSSMSTARNRDMVCHTCGGKGHFKKDCPNRKVMIINEDNEYETGDDADPDAPEDDDYDSDSFDAYPSEAQTIVVSQRVLNVQPSASTQLM
ncbi:hypothetical protein QYE76_031566 [Lolium multiflorum]|uniref:CCHC-type domain-containing protein n=1 Tax=Lolium multiflorum TaxID=4521 RepID=A0AAD8VKJ9_LOLMU|nr:hypothetical protein QYE76_031566 [Lolium multiflorum]